MHEKKQIYQKYLIMENNKGNDLEQTWIDK
jgi:hypothetical protein